MCPIATIRYRFVGRFFVSLSLYYNDRCVLILFCNARIMRYKFICIGYVSRVENGDFASLWIIISRLSGMVYIWGKPNTSRNAKTSDRHPQNDKYPLYVISSSGKTATYRPPQNWDFCIFSLEERPTSPSEIIASYPRATVSLGSRLIHDGGLSLCLEPFPSSTKCDKRVPPSY